jgi:RES domain-containing protein
MIAYRIADARHPIFDPTGAMLHGGRWNSIGQRVIYAGESYAGAMLEVLVHANLSAPPKKHRVVRITIPEQVKIEVVQPRVFVNWNSENLTVSREFGDKWLKELRTAVLKVPSVVTEGRENNILINPLHPQFSLILASEPELIHWDGRLFNARRK